MQRVLDPAQIEAFAERSLARIRLPDRTQLFAQRARRLRELSAPERVAVGQSIGGYLRLMAIVAEAQHSALAKFTSHTPLAAAGPNDEEIERARQHGMPLLHAVGQRREAGWRKTLAHICTAVLDAQELARELPQAARDACMRLLTAPADALDEQADALLALRASEVDLAAAPFIMSALQVYWLDLARHFSPADIPQLPIPGVCPLCGTLPVASVVRVDQNSQGYRYLHCGLCATEWHMVRVTCTQCQATKDLGYYLIEGGSEAVRAEACPQCRSYRKILYQEKDAAVEPLADDLASVALDLLMSAEGYQRASGNPLLWVAP